MAEKQLNIPIQGTVRELPEPPARKASEYLDAYKDWAFAAIKLVSESFSSIEIKLFKKIPLSRTEQFDVEEITIHESLAVLSHVNDMMTFGQLKEIYSTYMDLLGEAVWVLIRNKNKKIVEIWPLRPDFVSVKPDGHGGVKYYEFTPNGGGELIKIPPENIIFFKDHDPKNPYRGFGRVRPAALPLDTDEFSSNWNRNFFYNSAQPSMIIALKKAMKKEAKRRFIEGWYQKFSGTRNSHKIALLEGIAKDEFTVKELGNSIKEMDYLESKKFLRDEILAIWGVSKGNLGISEDVNRSTLEAMEARFVKHVVQPRLITFVGFLNEFYLPNWNDPSLFFNFEEPVPENVETKLKIYKNMLGGDNNVSWGTINEVRKKENLPPVDGGDIVYLPFGYSPVPGEASGEDDQEEEQERGIKAILSKVWKSKTDKGTVKMLKVKKETSKEMKKREQKYLRSRLVAPIPTISRQEATRIQLGKRIKREIKGDLQKLMIQIMKLHVKKKTDDKKGIYKKVVNKVLDETNKGLAKRNIKLDQEGKKKWKQIQGLKEDVAETKRIAQVRAEQEKISVIAQTRKDIDKMRAELKTTTSEKEKRIKKILADTEKRLKAKENELKRRKKDIFETERIAKVRGDQVVSAKMSIEEQKLKEQQLNIEKDLQEKLEMLEKQEIEVESTKKEAKEAKRISLIRALQVRKKELFNARKQVAEEREEVLAKIERNNRKMTDSLSEQLKEVGEKLENLNKEEYSLKELGRLSRLRESHIHKTKLAKEYDQIVKARKALESLDEKVIQRAKDLKLKVVETKQKRELLSEIDRLSKLRTGQLREKIISSGEDKVKRQKKEALDTLKKKEKKIKKKATVQMEELARKAKGTKEKEKDVREVKRISTIRTEQEKQAGLKEIENTAKKGQVKVEKKERELQKRAKKAEKKVNGILKAGLVKIEDVKKRLKIKRKNIQERDRISKVRGKQIRDNFIKKGLRDVQTTTKELERIAQTQAAKVLKRAKTRGKQLQLKAKKALKDAQSKAKSIVKKGQTLAKKGKKKFISELKLLRDKVSNAIKR